MKRYVFYVKNEVESAELQERLFEAGFRWGFFEKRVKYTHASLIFLRARELSYSDTIEYGFECLRKERDLIPYTYRDTKKPDFDVFDLDGAVKPLPPEKTIHIDKLGKDFSESTIVAALQEYVK